MKEATRDAAGVWIHVGDVVGGVTSKMSTIVGPIVQIGSSKVKIRLDQDAVPVGRGPVKDDEVWITGGRVFLVRRAAKSQQSLFTGEVDDELTKIERQAAAWLLIRAFHACMCTDPDPVACQAKCAAAHKGPQCPCHYISTAGEIRELLGAALKLGEEPVEAPEAMVRHLVEVYCEAGHQDRDAQRYAREFLAQHARLLDAILRQVGPFVAEDAGHVFGAGFTGGATYLRAYAHGLDPEGQAGR